MMTKILIAIGTLAIAIAAVASEGGIPGTGNLADNRTNNGCTCHDCPICQQIPGTGCYECGTVMCECNCYNGVFYMQETQLLNQPCL